MNYSPIIKILTLQSSIKINEIKSFLLSLSVYSELTEIKMFTGINIEQSLHVCPGANACLCDIHWLASMI